MKCCVAALTRGYEDISKYDRLIKRNEHISRHLTNKSIELVLFHEGNIPAQHQSYIMEKSPGLVIKFVNVAEKGAFREEKALLPEESGNRFPIGYRHMCSFWFVDFWNAVSDYDYLLRIDEDCNIDFSIDSVFANLDSYLFVFGDTCLDEWFVTIGMNKFSLEFIDRNRDQYEFKQTNTRPPRGPYTNVFGLALNRIREYGIFKQYVSAIDASDMIYKMRWGDLPLWGEAIHYIFGSETAKIDRNIRYFHASHSSYVN